MKIAIPTQDGETISAHFGSAPFFIILTLEDKSVISQDKVQNPGSNQQHTEHKHNHGKFDLIKDCQIVIAGGMGENAHQRLQTMGITVYLVKEKLVEDAVALFISGNLVHESGRLHTHHSH